MYLLQIIDVRVYGIFLKLVITSFGKILHLLLFSIRLIGSYHDSYYKTYII